MCINMRPISLYRLAVSDFKNDAVTARCEEDRIRGCVSIIDILV